MGEIMGSESSDNETLDSSRPNCDQQLCSSYEDEIDVNASPDRVILLPWHPSPPNNLEVGQCYDEGQIDVSEASNNVILLPWRSSTTNWGQEFGSCHEASTSASPHTNRISQFVGMGFPEKMVKKAIEENGENDAELVLEALLTYSALNKSPPEHEPVSCGLHFSESEEDILGDLSDADSCLENEEDAENLLDKDRKLQLLIDMGFSSDEASSAIDSSGSDTSILELMDFIYAAQTAKAESAHLQEPPQPNSNNDEMSPDDDHCYSQKVKKRKFSEAEERWKWKMESWRRRAKVSKQKRVFVDEDEGIVHFSTNMTGFGVPNNPRPLSQRKLPEAAVGPPYFYFENVACTPKGVWTTISRFLYEIEPEFVDSLHFCSAARKRGYVHNLPIDKRYPLQPFPPQTIQEALPMTKQWWPSWDKRTKLNCLSTVAASAKLTQRLRDALERWDGVPPLETQRYVLFECRKWNLVWTGKNKVAPLEPDEIEMILGYPKDHTRGGGTSRTERYKSLGNSFQVDTVAYHFSVLKSMFPNGITVLSLFSGIGGAEVALDRLGIPLKTVVSVEISEVNRNIIRSWWEQTNQKGKLIELEDVQELTPDKLECLISKVGGFDLVVGGSPCNNLTGNNRVSRDGLLGDQSVLFYDYFRILNVVKCIMGYNK